MSSVYKTKVLPQHWVVTLLGMFAFFIPLHRTAAMVSLILAIVVYLVTKQFKEPIISRSAIVLAPTLLYVLYFFNLLFHYSPATSWFPLEKKILLLLFPVFVYFVNVSSRQLLQLLIFFIAGCAIFTFLSIYNAYVFYNLPTQHFELVHLPHQLAIDLHAPYLSLLLTLANFSILYIVRSQKRFYLSLLLVFYFTVLIIIISSRTAFILNLLVLFAFLFDRAVSLKREKVFYISSVIFLFGVFLLFMSYGHMQERFMSVFRGSGEGVSERLLVYKAAIAIISDFPLSGVGVQHVQDVLVQYYMQFDYAPSMYVLNPHNEYLYSGVAMGVLGICFMLAMLLTPIYLCFKNGRFLLMLPYIIFAVAFLTEVLLERFWGVASFVLFYTLFIRLSSESKPILQDTASEKLLINVAKYQ
ncbi:glycosyltransferase [Flammeovirgaceae bacterium 311]|nr:glycosyltransferase [Flammeovirgaceae bacterium 311]